MHLVPQLGGGQVVVSGHGGLTGGAGHAAQLVLVTSGVEKEAHACQRELSEHFTDCCINWKSIAITKLQYLTFVIKSLY